MGERNLKSNRSGFTFDELIAGERPEEFIESAQPFMKLMMQYQCAMLEVQTKFEVLNTELSMDSDRNPIESISCRIKKPMSIVEKLKRKGVEVSLSSIEKNLHDVAGIRVVCFFPKDIYRLAEKICSQDDIRLIEKKDYIQNPKPNGYRSLHLILEVPVFFADEKKWMQVEVQFRTIAMDFWASIEHKVKYKKDIDASTSDIVEKLRGCAESIHSIDLRMQEISECIEASN
jgi:putative GTP pyrophosphokinase